MSKLKHQRKIVNILINPTFQMRMALRFIIIYLVVTGLLQAYFIFELNDYINKFIEVFPVTTEQHLLLHDIAINTVIVMSLTLAVGALSIFAMSVFYSHKIAGPIYVLKNNIQQLMEKNYSIRTHFREGDEFNEIADALSQLADKLKEEHPS